MRKQQKGMTTLGFILTLTVIGAISFGVVQMVPVYLENMSLVQILNQTQQELEGQSASVSDIRKSLAKRINIEGLREVDARDFAITRSAGGFNVQIQYERKRPYFANLYLLAEFEQTVEIIR